MGMTEYKSETFIVKLEFTRQSLEMIRNGTPIVYKPELAPDIIIKVYKDGN